MKVDKCPESASVQRGLTTSRNFWSVGNVPNGFVNHIFTVLSERGADVDSAFVSPMADPESHLA
ncbi:MAG: hypothetical protein ACJAVT_000936 [Yoonia sp.]|jgi:hypothetical protein